VFLPINWNEVDQQERRESNPQPPVLETGALPIELRSYGSPLPAGELAQKKQVKPHGKSRQADRPQCWAVASNSPAAGKLPATCKPNRLLLPLDLVLGPATQAR
jgi:hypothetical protein